MQPSGHSVWLSFDSTGRRAVVRSTVATRTALTLPVSQANDSKIELHLMLQNASGASLA